MAMYLHTALFAMTSLSYCVAIHSFYMEIPSWMW